MYRASGVKRIHLERVSILSICIDNYAPGVPLCPFLECFRIALLEYLCEYFRQSLTWSTWTGDTCSCLTMEWTSLSGQGSWPRGSQEQKQGKGCLYQNSPQVS